MLNVVELQAFVDQFAEGVVVEVTSDIVAMNGAACTAGYSDNRIFLDEEAIASSAKLFHHINPEIDAMDTAIIFTVHELGHHIAGHQLDLNITLGGMVRAELDAYLQGRQIALIMEKHYPGFLRLYDFHNGRNVRTYVEALFTGEDAKKMWNDCLKAIDRIRRGE